MKDTGRIMVFVLGISAVWRITSAIGNYKALLWLIRIILAVLKVMSVIGVAAAVLVGAMAGWEEWRNSREGREAKKKLADRRRVGLCPLT